MHSSVSLFQGNAHLVAYSTCGQELTSLLYDPFSLVFQFVNDGTRHTMQVGPKRTSIDPMLGITLLTYH